jgi:hypothetical protein
MLADVILPGVAVATVHTVAAHHEHHHQWAGQYHEQKQHCRNGHPHGDCADDGNDEG